MANEIINISGIECYEENGTAYLKLDTVARGLGFTRIAESGNEVVRWERVEGYLNDLGVPTCGHDDFIPENVFYRLAMKAKNDVAEAFQAKIADEVIPSIRKHGGYLAGQESMSGEELLAKALQFAEKVLADREKRIKQLETENAIQNQQIADFHPIKQYVDTILESKDSLNVTQIASDYGISARKLNLLLRKEKVQYKSNGQWILYSEYRGKGFTDSKTYTYEHSDGHQGSKVHTRWTQKGRMFIHDILTNKYGITPLMDRE